MSETELPAALADDLDGTFPALVERFQTRIYRFALRLTDSPEDAEECAQDAFVRAYRALQGYDRERIAALALQPWLYQITLNVVRNRLRGKRLSVVSLDAAVSTSGDATLLDGLVDHHREFAPEPMALAAEERRELAKLLARLRPAHRTAVTLRFIEELSYAEAAGILGQPVGTVKSNAHRGVRSLRVDLEARLRALELEEIR